MCEYEARSSASKVIYACMYVCMHACMYACACDVVMIVSHDHAVMMHRDPTHIQTRVQARFKMQSRYSVVMHAHQCVDGLNLQGLVI